MGKPPKYSYPIEPCPECGDPGGEILPWYQRDIAPGHRPGCIVATGRMRAHELLDTLWKERGWSRADAYIWLQIATGKPRMRAHIGLLNKEEVWDVCRKLVGFDPEQQKIWLANMQEHREAARKMTDEWFDARRALRRKVRDSTKAAKKGAVEEVKAIR